MRMFGVKAFCFARSQFIGGLRNLTQYISTYGLRQVLEKFSRSPGG
jgi:hypothetical protein